MFWEMIVSNLTCMQIQYIRHKHAKWMVWSFNANNNLQKSNKTLAHYIISSNTQ
ncbi:hypothetical protein LDENG_00102430 [Lucifuga dentata]|nr:hypothetical protein LDENG_00102430 [Lucifuga dentata]